MDHHELNFTAAIATITNFVSIEDLSKDLFKNFVQPSGRGNFKK